MVDRTNKFATQTFVDTRVKTGTYDGTETAFDIACGFAPKSMRITVDTTGEVIFKTNKHSASKCLMRKNVGQDQVLKSFILEQNGVTFGTDKVTIGNSVYLNKVGESYTYTIIG